jgi:hypothetical protein
MKSPMIVSCACGQVQLAVVGVPIAVVACHCDDCQEGSRRIEALPGASASRDSFGGTSYLLYRKDRVKCSKGENLLRDLRLRDRSPTKRVIASCCNSAMFLDFEKGHWLSVYRGRFGDHAPPLQMRIQTKFSPKDRHSPYDTLSYASFPLRFFAKLFLARAAMLIRR